MVPIDPCREGACAPVFPGSQAVASARAAGALGGIQRTACRAAARACRARRCQADGSSSTCGHQRSCVRGCCIRPRSGARCTEVCCRQAGGAHERASQTGRDDHAGQPHCIARLAPEPARTSQDRRVSQSGRPQHAPAQGWSPERKAFLECGPPHRADGAIPCAVAESGGLGGSARTSRAGAVRFGGAVMRSPVAHHTVAAVRQIPAVPRRSDTEPNSRHE
jgi:hypothetical protein